jgi:hypothetical protein
MFEHKYGWTLGLAISIVLACSGSKKGGSAGTVSGYCESYCEQSHDCDQSINEQTCTNSCNNDFAALGPKLRTDFLKSISECVAQQDCATILAGDALSDCSEEAAATLSPSSSGTAFCSAYEKAVEKCDDRDFDKAACFEQSKAFSDSAIAAAQKCLDDSCDDIDDCVGSSLGEVTDGPRDGNPPVGNNGATNSGGASNTGGTRATIPMGGASNGGSGLAGTGGTIAEGACEQTDPSQCVGTTTLNACNERGVYQLIECAELTASIGFDGYTCTAGGCDPGQPLDPECMTGVASYCACTELGSCTEDEALNAYVACYRDEPVGTQSMIQCFANYEVTAAEQCAVAIQACAPSE